MIYRNAHIIDFNIDDETVGYFTSTPLTILGIEGGLVVRDTGMF